MERISDHPIMIIVHYESDLYGRSRSLEAGESMRSNFPRTASNRLESLIKPLRYAAVVAIAILAPFLSARGDDPKPAVKDSKPAFRPAQAKFKTAVKPAEAKPGDIVTFEVTARIDETWHIYQYQKKAADQGPRPTQFDFFDTGGLKIEGDWKSSSDPIKKKDDAFPDLESVEFFEHAVTWSIKLKIPSDAKPGPRKLRCQASYQLCSSGPGASCTFPGAWTLDTAVLNVLAGDAKAAATSSNGTPAASNSNATQASDPKSNGPVETAKTESARLISPKESAGSKTDPAPSDAKPSATSAQSTGSIASKSTDTGVKTDVEKSIEQGLLSFILLSAGAGLLALVMPCVWPMVPITVNFFVKQGRERQGSTLGLAITYCLSIIGIFTAVGLVFSLAFGASSLQQLATSAWLNGFVAILFLAFGLSLLGLFEIGLPSFLLNASAKRESKGGLVGVVFMALTLTITSFTCTFPVVGGLLVMAAQGKYFYPIIGLATFATVLALPFFLLALAPGLLAKAPKSGDWMNAVKLVGGLIEIGAAFKFINNFELAFVTPDQAWFGAYTVLTIWVALALVCGLYLLGLFRTDHDHDAPRVGPGRMIAGIVFLSGALFLAPALFGNPPQTVIWNRLIVGLLPPDVDSLQSRAQLAAGSTGATSGGGEVAASSNDPKIAIQQEKTFHGVVWGMSYENALKQAKLENKPVIIDFTGVFCTNCRLMEQSVFPRPEVIERLNKFVRVQLYTDTVPIASITQAERKELAETNALLQNEIVKSLTNPFYVAISPDGKVIDSINGAHEPEVFVAFLDRVLAASGTGEKLARNGSSEK
jgi:thiol:disulfide interchange protein